MKKKHICVVTSTRADYNYFRLILRKIISSRLLKLSLCVTGTHLLEKYGKTISYIKNDNIPIAKIIPMYTEDTVAEGNMGRAVAKGIEYFTEAFIDLKPDLLLVLGDRYEPLAGVIAASTLSIPIAHIHGGDNVFRGQIDEQIRHSITKFSHLHFPATEKSAKRIKLLGEEEWRIHKVGSPSIDHFFLEIYLKKSEICKEINLNPLEKIVICLQHPYTFEHEKSGEHMKITLEVLKELKLQSVIIYPNNDPGSHLIIEEIKKKKDESNFKVFKNLGHFEFYSLMQNVDLLIGNSSAGMIESPIFKLPVVNIGDRNKGRESADNVINVGYNYNSIKKAIKKTLSENFKKKCENIKNPYGDGKASERIVKILENLEINEKLLIKQLTYNV